MTQTPEEKVIQKIVTVLAADAVIKNYTGGRVYDSHISSIAEPKFPAISLFLLSSKALFSPPNQVDMVIQIDAWLPNKDFTDRDLKVIHRKIREKLHRQFLSDTSLNLIVSQCIEDNAGPLMYEEDTSLYHYPVSYSVRAS